MKRFHFKLEKVLKLRENELDRARSEFKAAMARVNALEDEIAEVDKKREATRSMLLNERQKPALEVSRILTIEQGMRMLMKLKESLHLKLNAANQEADQTRSQFQEAKRSCETLERIKEKQMERFEKGLRAEEMKGIDEAAVNRFIKEKS